MNAGQSSDNRTPVDVAKLFASRPPGSKSAIFLRGGVQIHMRVSDPEAAMKEVPVQYANINMVHAYEDSSSLTGTKVYGSPFLLRDGSGFCIVQMKNGVVSKRRLVQAEEDSSAAAAGTEDYGEHLDIPECFARSIARLKQGSILNRRLVQANEHSSAAAATTSCTKAYGRTRVPPRDGYTASVKQRSFLKRRVVQADEDSSAAAATAAFGRLRLKRLL